jgi:predicted transcriptional regulator
MRKSEDEPNFREIFKGRRIPILTLDNKWYELFPADEKPSHIKELEDNLNELLKRQGKLANDMKDLKKLKVKLMEEIIANMDTDDSSNGKQKLKKMTQNQKMILEIGEKMKAYEDELADIPYLIKSVNEDLMIESAVIWYQKISNNKDKINEITGWVLKVRDELKEKILMKQDMETKNATIYSYMHDLLGLDIIEAFDEHIL